MTADLDGGSGQPPGLLAGVTVLDLSQHLAGPYATQILGDLGARVVKVEPPSGDPTRSLGPHFRDGTSAYYLSVNRNKESVCLDVRSEAGRATLLELVGRCDVVVENFRPGTLERLGLGFEALVAANPSIVLCSISGFGQDGPYRERPAFDIIVQALSGVMSVTGEQGGRPVRTGVPIGDVCAGMYGVIGVLAALGRRSVDGRPHHVDVSMLDTQLAMLSYVAAYFLVGGELAGPQGSGHMSIPTYRAWRCRDGREVVTAANLEKQWAAMCEALGVPGIVDDPRFASNEARRQHRGALDAVLEPAFARGDSADVLERLVAAGVPAAPINTIDRALADPQVEHRGMVVAFDDDDDDGGGGRPAVVGSPLHVDGGASRARRPPRLGEHSVEVLSDLGVEAAAIEALIATGALRRAEQPPAPAVGIP